MGGGTGVFKQTAVIEWLYDKIPAVLKVFFTQKDLENLVDTIVGKQLMRLTTLECSVEEMDMAGVQSACREPEKVHCVGIITVKGYP